MKQATLAMLGHLLVPGVALSTFFLTGAIRRYAIARGLLDVPGERSSHSLPTPRGGGIAIAVIILAMLPVLYELGWITQSLLWSLAGAGTLIAAIGFIDDHRDVPVGIRLSVHFLAAAWVTAWLGGLPPLTIFGRPLNLGLVGYSLAVIGVAWLINLYNFMDGIDGIAGIEAITVGIAAGVLLHASPAGGYQWSVPVLLAAAAAGFLWWNFPKARVFMGDGGSGFLGLVFGAMLLHASWISPELFWAWLILLGAFVVDASFTLLRRIVRGDRLHEAHRTHAYQHMAARLGAHAPVAVGVGAINVLWLFPMAALVALGKLDGTVGLALAYTPLVALAVYVGAGVPGGRRAEERKTTGVS